MPQVLHKLVGKLEDQGKKKDDAWALATWILQKKGVLKKGTNKLKKKIIKRKE